MLDTHVLAWADNDERKEFRRHNPEMFALHVCGAIVIACATVLAFVLPVTLASSDAMYGAGGFLHLCQSRSRQLSSARIGGNSHDAAAKRIGNVKSLDRRKERAHHRA